MGRLLDTLVAYYILDVIRIVTIGCNKGQRQCCKRLFVTVSYTHESLNADTKRV